ncbi:MAG: glycosyltransferase family 4 protein [Bacilli bacterium]|nr:glycosyltransferase family 4 protein [Bacilli bacterium]
MKILVITQYFYPETFRINDIVSELVNRGHDVTVVTGLPNYPKGEIYPGYEDSYKTISNYFGAKVYRCNLRPRKNGAINLALNYLSFARQAKKTLKKIKPCFDIIYYYGLSPISSGIPAIKYGKKYNIKKVIYNLDIWPDSVRDSRGGKTMSKANLIYVISKIISKYVYSNFDLILNKCDEFGDYLIETLNISTNKMVTLYEHAENTYLTVNKMPIDNGIIDFMFLGNIGKAQNCDLMIRAFASIDKSNAILHFVGDGSYLDALKELTLSLGLENHVFFHGRKTIEETIAYYNLADVCLLALSNKTCTGLTPPTKLSGYMAACRPIIASINGAARTIIEDAKCGLVCPADDIAGFIALMNMITSDKNEVLEMGMNGRKYFLEKFTLDKHIDSLEKYLRSTYLTEIIEEKDENIAN